MQKEARTGLVGSDGRGSGSLSGAERGTESLQDVLVIYEQQES